jgi:hypothetical protein
MKFLPEQPENYSTTGKQLSSINPKLPWINLLVIGVYFSATFFLLSISYAASFFQTPTQLLSDPVEISASGKPQKIMIANVTGEQATLVFFSEKAGQASAYVGQKRFGDDRGDEISDRVHLITLDGLEPGKNYRLRICGKLDCGQDSQDWYGLAESVKQVIKLSEIEGQQIAVGGRPIWIQTGPSLPIEKQATQPVFGTAQPLSQTAVLLMTLEEKGSDKISAPLATLVNPKAGWALDLANARTKDDSGYFPLRPATTVNFRLLKADGSESLIIRYYQEVKDQVIHLVR